MKGVAKTFEVVFFEVCFPFDIVECVLIGILGCSKDSQLVGQTLYFRVFSFWESLRVVGVALKNPPSCVTFACHSKVITEKNSLDDKKTSITP